FHCPFLSLPSPPVPPVPLSPPPFLFSSFAPHCALHSFPTRRSSDLPTPPFLSGTCMACCSRRGRWPWPRRPVRLLSILAGQLVRSEEHTSELQSRVDIVCRLLLEKKKKNKKRTCDRTQDSRQPHREH